MGKTGTEINRIPAATNTKEQFMALWRSFRAAADERWELDLRSTANLIGFALFPVGWRWDEYPPLRNIRPMPYEQKAQSTNRLGLQYPSSQTEAGLSATQNGIASRKNVVERHLMRMIKRQEIPVTVTNHRMEGYPLDHRMRLDEALRFDVATNGIGLFDLKDCGFDFHTDTLTVLDVLDQRCAWHRNSSVNNWFYVERYLRINFEMHGLPNKQEDYAKLAVSWYGEHNAEKREPAMSGLRQLVSNLYAEYAGSDSEI